MTTPEMPNHQPASEATAASPAETATTTPPTVAGLTMGDPAEAPLMGGSATAPAKASKPLNRTLLVAAASFIVGALLGVAGTAATINSVNDANAKAASDAAAKAEADKPHVLKSAASSCGITNSAGAKLGDNDTSLSLDGKGDEDYSGLSMTSINCVMDAIKVPDYVRAQMNKTRALDGTQRESWGNISATWSYHPNTGFNLGLTEKR